MLRTTYFYTLHYIIWKEADNAGDFSVSEANCWISAGIPEVPSTVVEASGPLCYYFHDSLSDTSLSCTLNVGEVSIRSSRNQSVCVCVWVGGCVCVGWGGVGWGGGKHLSMLNLYPVIFSNALERVNVYCKRSFGTNELIVN